MDKERRYINPGFTIEKRDDGTTGKIIGLGIVFNKESSDLGGFKEIISPDATRNIKFEDVVSLFNHDPNKVLARTPDTLSVEQKDDGVYYSFEPSDTQASRDLVINIDRKEVRGSSFAFQVADGGDTWEKHPSGEYWIRTINEFSAIYDLSPVTFPAYPDTTVAKRALDQVKTNVEQKFDEIPLELRQKEYEFLKLNHK